MLKNCNEEEGQAKGEIEISDVTYDIFDIIVFYINGRNVFQLKFDVNNDTISQTNILIHLLAASHTYRVNNLKVICEKRLIMYVTKDNVLSYLDIAIMYNAVYLKNYTKKFIKIHIDDMKRITQLIDYIKINPINPKTILADIHESELSVEYAFCIKYNDA